MTALTEMVERSILTGSKRSRQEVLDSSGWELHVNPAVLNAMPWGEGDPSHLHFFRLERILTDEQLSMEYKRRGLTPASPRALFAVNDAHPQFADDHPNLTHWWREDASTWGFAAFPVLRHGTKRVVYIEHNVSVWNVGWWAAGVRVH